MKTITRFSSKNVLHFFMTFLTG